MATDEADTLQRLQRTARSWASCSSAMTAARSTPGATLSSPNSARWWRRCAAASRSRTRSAPRTATCRSQADVVPHRHQPRRRHAGRHRPLRRWRQRRGKAGIACRSGRHHGVRDGLRPDPPAARFGYDFAGEQKVKGQDDPIAGYRVRMPGRTPAPEDPRSRRDRSTRKRCRAALGARSARALADAPPPTKAASTNCATGFYSQPRQVRVPIAHDRAFRGDQPAHLRLQRDLVHLSVDPLRAVPAVPLSWC